MYDDPRIDPEMRSAALAQEAAAALMPPVSLSPPLDEQRRVNDVLQCALTPGGPEMESVADRWVLARGRRVQCRVYRPSAAVRPPVVIYLHGGGWVFSSIDTHDRVARETAADSGAAVISVDYALSPEARFPQALEECAAVVRHLVARAEDWDLDGGRIALSGDSAGANLALATALLLRDAGDPALRGLMLHYPVSDCGFDTPSYREYATGFGLTADGMRAFWDLYAPDEISRRSPYASVLRADLRRLPPVRVHLAELDVLHSEGAALAGQLREAGIATEVETFRGLLHGYARATGAVTRAREAALEAGAWLRDRLA